MYKPSRYLELLDELLDVSCCQRGHFFIDLFFSPQPDVSICRNVALNVVTPSLNMPITAPVACDHGSGCSLWRVNGGGASLGGVSVHGEPSLGGVAFDSDCA